VGAVLGRFDGRRGWVNHLAVDPRARSNGIGSTLMRELERRLRAKGCQKVNLHVVRTNRQVCVFYEELGYEHSDLLFMGKWLRP
jgi:ribosomal protein S18 acetylase RimI-like enzyme